MHNTKLTNILLLLRSTKYIQHLQFNRPIMSSHSYTFILLKSSHFDSV